MKGFITSINKRETPMILAINNLLLWLLFLIIVGNRKAIDIINSNETKCESLNITKG